MLDSPFPNDWELWTFFDEPVLTGSGLVEPVTEPSFQKPREKRNGTRCKATELNPKPN